MTHSPRYETRRPSRRGVAMVFALVILVVVTGLIAGWAAGALRDYRRLESHLDRTQATWLVHAGISRAVAGLRASPEYDGEVWQIAPEELGGRKGAVVTIRVAPVAENDASHLVIVSADYPSDTPRRQRVRREILVTLPSAGDS